VTLLGIERRHITVGPLDLVDGTPVIDIKPYIRTVDSFPNSSLGWLGPVEEAELKPPPFQIEMTPIAQRQIDWLRENWDINFTERALEILRRDPKPHRTRRILQLGENRFRMACGAWRLYFRLDGTTVLIEEVDKGYSDESLVTPGYEKITHREAQIAFGIWNNSR
jgi:hypothetical protein